MAKRVYSHVVTRLASHRLELARRRNEPAFHFDTVDQLMEWLYETEGVEQQQCAKCNEIKTIDNFYVHNASGGHMRYCKPCMRAYVARNYRENKARAARRRKET